MNPMKPRVRFAPSPTGYLHIGGARTALFNWLYARHTGGTFVLRIEDTDAARNTQEAVDAILSGLRWLGLDWDEGPITGDATGPSKGDRGPYFQSQRKANYTARVEALLSRGLAYEHEGAIKFKMTREPILIPDMVVGDVLRPLTDREELDPDWVLVRSDGQPVFHFVNVVDDLEMGITHVIRGVDHLTNAARQTQIYLGMGWSVPDWAHVPLIHGGDGAKLSKRHGAQGIEEYRAMGYLPAALRNYLVRLGWSHGDDEIISTEQLVEWFDIDGINKSAARFDFKKLDDLNGHYLRNSPDADLLSGIQGLLPHLDFPALRAIEIDPKAPVRSDIALAREVEAFLPAVAKGSELAALFEAKGWDAFAAALPALKERAKTLAELIGQALFIVAQRPLALDEKARKLMDADAKTVVGALIPRLEASPEWTAEALEALVRTYAEETGAKLGKVAQPLRSALTGRTVSPPVFDVMSVLGREETLGRLADQAAS